jgi:hypothetical protein
MVWLWQAVKVPPPPPRVSLWDPRLLWTAVALVAVIGIGVLVLVLLDRWRKSLAQDEEPPSANDQLSHFRLLYDRGELSQEEFDRIRNLLAGRMREELDVRAAVPAPLTPAEKPLEPPPAAPASPETR